MSEVERFAFPQTDNQLGMASSLPYLPLTLNYQNRELTVSGLLDTGATINVMPYQIGLQLGALWEQQTTPVQLTGNLANLPAYGFRNCGAISTSTFSFSRSHARQRNAFKDAPRPASPNHPPNFPMLSFSLQDAERPSRHSHAERGNEKYNPCSYRFLF